MLKSFDWIKLTLGISLIILSLQIPLYAHNINIPPQTIFYPGKSLSSDTRDNYPLELLSLALKKSGEDFVLQPNKEYLVQDRVLEELAKGRHIDVAWTMSSKQREAELLPIRIPIYKNLIGTRLLLIRKADTNSFGEIRALDQLSQKKAGQGHDWPDKTILEYNGLSVAGVVRYESLFLMLSAQRIDYIPRSIVEIWDEAKRYRSHKIVIEPNLVLCYPAAVYYFVNRSNASLAAQIKEGLLKAQQDGSFDHLFKQHFGALIEKATLNQRSMLVLKNPTVKPSSVQTSPCNKQSFNS